MRRLEEIQFFGSLSGDCQVAPTWEINSFRENQILRMRPNYALWVSVSCRRKSCHMWKFGFHSVPGKLRIVEFLPSRTSLRPWFSFNFFLLYLQFEFLCRINMLWLIKNHLVNWHATLTGKLFKKSCWVYPKGTDLALFLRYMVILHISNCSSWEHRPLTLESEISTKRNTPFIKEMPI